MDFWKKYFLHFHTTFSFLRLFNKIVLSSAVLHFRLLSLSIVWFSLTQGLYFFFDRSIVSRLTFFYTAHMHRVKKHPDVYEINDLINSQISLTKSFHEAKKWTLEDITLKKMEG